jgi:hypothetical protein
MNAIHVCTLHTSPVSSTSDPQVDIPNPTISHFDIDEHIHNSRLEACAAAIG